MKSVLSAVLVVFAYMNVYSQTGCNDPAATNYNSAVTINNGSCIYDSTRAPISLKGVFNSLLHESSGLVFTDGKLWTHNDSGGQPELYRIDTANGQLLQVIHVDNYPNNDWEDVTADSNYIYIGDFGNNNGTRTNLKILKINKAQITTASTVHINAQAINFSYADQTSFTSSSNTNFNCESLISIGNALYIFTKDHGDLKTRCYQLSKTPGTYTISPYTSYDVKALVSGAAYNPVLNEVVLSGYDLSHKNSFFYLLNNFSGNLFFSGNKRRIDFGTPYVAWQAEGIEYASNTELFISCETTSDVSASLFATSRSSWNTIAGIDELTESRAVKAYPNPVKDMLTVEALSSIESFELIGNDGHSCFIYKPSSLQTKVSINISEMTLADGLYTLKVKTESSVYYKKVLLIKT